MTSPASTVLELNIARARIVLSLITLLSIYVDPTTPHLASWMPIRSGPFAIDTYTLAALCAHLAYSIASYGAARRHGSTATLASITAALDILFAMVVALFTEGPTSPSFVYFMFAVIAVGCRTGFRATATVTLASVTLYFVLLLVLTRGERHLYIMRPAYLAITGYLIGFLGQQRVSFEMRVRELETTAARQSIARFLHDGYAQGLAGINLRLETCRTLLQADRGDEALVEVTELQAGVAREFDDVRAYIRSLADLDRAPSRDAGTVATGTVFRVRADFSASGLLVEQVLQIMLEGMRNTRRHGNARRGEIAAAATSDTLTIAIDDDGIGFERAATPPWSIASRVAESGGRLKIASTDRPGAHITVELPLNPPHEEADSPHPRG